MKHREERAELRGAVYRGDAGSLVGILKPEVWPENALQLMGDGLLGMLQAPTEGIDEAARRCVAALWDRGWEDDADLAAGLEAALGFGPAPLLRPLPVPSEARGRVGGRPGRRRRAHRSADRRCLAPQSAIEYAEETEEDDDDERWLWVECEGSREGYRDMELFIATLDHQVRALDGFGWPPAGFRSCDGCAFMVRRPVPLRIPGRQRSLVTTARNAARSGGNTPNVWDHRNDLAS
jgi:hypothetical protein